jgi:hypothetical protein
MNIIRISGRIIFRNPMILLISVVLMFFVSAFNVFIPLVPLIKGISGVTEDGLFESVVALLQFVLDPEVLPAFIVLCLIFCIILSLIISLVLSGYLYITDGALNGKEKERRKFSKGIRLNFNKFFLITLRAFIIMVIYVIFLLIACIPAIVVTKAAFMGNTDLLIPTLFIDLITIVTVFFCLMFYKSYILYWYPGVLKNIKKPFKIGRILANNSFWQIVSGLIVFDAVSIICLIAITMISSPLIKFLLGWILGTIILITFVVFILKGYNEQLRRYLAKL